MELEKLAQNSLENLRENSPQMSQFIELEKTSCWSQDGQSVDRPVDRPPPGRPANGQKSDRCASGRPAS